MMMSSHIDKYAFSLDI